MAKQQEDSSVTDGTAGHIATELIAIAKDDPETKEAAKNLASSAKIVTGTLKRALFPLAVMNYGYDKAENYFKTRFQSDMSEHTLKIPAENVVDPKPSLAGPALQGLAYSHDEEELRNMYLNLLASSMNSQTASSAHPSYVETIKQLSAEEAKLLKIYLSSDQFAIAKLHHIINNERNYRTVARHILNTNDALTGSPVVIDMMPAYVENWIRLGLVEVDYTAHQADENAYKWVDLRPEYLDVATIATPAVADGEFQPTVEVIKGLLVRTKYGDIFGKIVGITS